MLELELEAMLVYVAMPVLVLELEAMLVLALELEAMLVLVAMQV